ncbi:MAG TPA: type II toxin-antitoxin system HicB family antitoxin, partial [Fimbriimonadaceae bacterium]|nr:type II toxin-antitoxin system HicB family antitoxin [Fimbriimonadaceae bacterium]
MELRHYLVVFENAGEDGWGAYVPDLPGCTAGGASLDEAVKSAQKSIELWIAHANEVGDPIPPPSTEGLSLSVAVRA